MGVAPSKSFYLPLVNVDGLDEPTPRAVRALSDKLETGVQALVAGDEATGFRLLARGFMQAEIRWIDLRRVLESHGGIACRLSCARAPDVFSVRETAGLTELQKHAMIVKAHVQEQWKQTPRSETIRHINFVAHLFPGDAVVKAYVGKKNMTAGQHEQGVMDIKRALRMDERTNVTSYWTLFCHFYGLYNQTGPPQDRLYWRESRHALENFTRLAPPCHWHAGCGFLMLFLINFEVLTKQNAVELIEDVPKGRRKEVLSRLLSRHPPSRIDPLVETYKKGLRCLEMRAKWLPPLGKDQQEDTIGPAKALAKLLSEVLKRSLDDPVEDMKLLKECSVCGRKDSAFLRCSGCGVAAYCGRAHQKQHWQTHKQECGKLKKASEVRLDDLISGKLSRAQMGGEEEEETESAMSLWSQAVAFLLHQRLLISRVVFLLGTAFAAFCFRGLLNESATRVSSSHAL